MELTGWNRSLWNLLLNKFCENTDSERFKNEVKKLFPDIFSDKLRRCNEFKIKFQVKEHAKLVFKLKRTVPLAAPKQIDKELGKL